VNPLRWALVGTSGYAERECLPSFAATPAAHLAAVVSSSRDRAQEFAGRHGIERGYDDISRVCAAGDISAVWIASPSHMHYAHARAAIAAGKHVLLEKPVALDVGEGWDLVERAEQAGVKLATGYQARYVPGHQRMQQLIAEGELGSLVSVRSLYALRRPGPPRTWRGQRQTARWGVLADIGTHHIDLMRMLAGEIEDATGYSAHQHGYETEDLAVASLRFACGALGTMTVTGNYFRPTTVLEVVGSKARVVAVDTSPSGQGRVTLEQADGSETDITGATPLSNQAQLAAVTTVFSGGDVPYATGADGARNVEILAAIAP
jgi:1,5-anhydro-D-fructose reductase (1,5-anhydro-D-mannitol-forming)